jgi:hypothetical protein
MVSTQESKATLGNTASSRFKNEKEKKKKNRGRKQNECTRKVMSLEYMKIFYISAKFTGNRYRNMGRFRNTWQMHKKPDQGRNASSPQRSMDKGNEQALYHRRN